MNLWLTIGIIEKKKGHKLVVLSAGRTHDESDHGQAADPDGLIAARTFQITSEVSVPSDMEGWICSRCRYEDADLAQSMIVRLEIEVANLILKGVRKVLKKKDKTR